MDIYTFANLYKFNDKLTILAQRTNEKWCFKNADEGDIPILKNYICNTFQKVYEEGKVIEEDNYALFNTGLFTKFYQPLYGLFTQNNTTDEKEVDKKWFLNGFFDQYDAMSLMDKIKAFPKRADYFDKPELLILNPEWDIHIQYDHILSDENNKLRIPEEIRNKSNLQTLLVGAIDNMKKQVMCNYKLAVPQYYNGKIQLLLPICLLRPNIPDLALAVERIDSAQCYQGRTCLTLEMAYNNARLIVKPEDNWLEKLI